MTSLRLQLITPASALQPYVRHYWFFHTESVLPVYQEEYMHPTGGFGLVFNLGDPLFLDAEPISAPVFLDGANTRSRRMGFTGHVDALGIRFAPGGAFPFLGVPLIDLQNELNVLESLSDTSVLLLYSRLCESPSLALRSALMEDWLVKRLSEGIVPSALIPPSLMRLRQDIIMMPAGLGRSTIPNVANDLAISQRQLEHIYRSQVGMTPMHYLRLQRIERARLTLIKKPQSTTHLAAALGFYDQAHFIRDFRSVIGITPYAYMRRKHGAPANEDYRVHRATG